MSADMFVFRKDLSDPLLELLHNIGQDLFMQWHIYASGVLEWIFFLKYNPDLAKKILLESNHKDVSKFLYFYCINIEDDEDIWRNLASRTTSMDIQWQYRYCKDIKERPEMLNAMINNIKTHRLGLFRAYWYCVTVRDCPELWQLLVTVDTMDVHYYQYLYCKRVKDREPIWRTLANAKHAPEYQYKYLLYVKDRPEMVSGLMKSEHPDAEMFQQAYVKFLQDRKGRNKKQ